VLHILLKLKLKKFENKIKKVKKVKGQFQKFLKSSKNLKMADPRYVKRRYLNPKVPGSFGGASTFIKNSKYRDKDTVLDTLRELKSYTLHKPTRQRFPRRPIMCSHIDYMWSMDIVIYEKYKRQNRGHSNILLAVDCLSKFLMCEPLKGRTADDVHDALLRMFKYTKRKPEKIFCDRDTAFRSGKVMEMLKTKGIEMYHGHSRLKASLSERYVGRLKRVLARIFTNRGKNNWIDVLDDVTNQINHSYNRSIKMSSVNVSKKNESEVWHNLYSKYINPKKKRKYKFNVGDLVKISKKRLIFDKAYEQGWSDETFIVRERHDSHLVEYYILEDTEHELIESTFSPFDLQLVKKFENSDE
jgi:hypothetical protein